MKRPFLFYATLFYGLAIICAGVCITFATGRQTSYGGMGSMQTGIDAGLNGGATGFGIMASTFILCGTFFLYKHLTNKNGQ